MDGEPTTPKCQNSLFKHARDILDEVARQPKQDSPFKIPPRPKHWTQDPAFVSGPKVHGLALELHLFNATAPDFIQAMDRLAEAMEQNTLALKAEADRLERAEAEAEAGDVIEPGDEWKFGRDDDA